MKVKVIPPTTTPILVALPHPPDVIVEALQLGAETKQPLVNC